MGVNAHVGGRNRKEHDGDLAVEPESSSRMNDWRHNPHGNYTPPIVERG